MNPSPEEIADVEATILRERPKIIKAMEKSLRSISRVTPISQKQALISIVGAWIASYAHEDLEEAQRILASFDRDLAATVEKFCDGSEEQAGLFERQVAGRA